VSVSESALTLGADLNPFLTNKINLWRKSQHAEKVYVGKLIRLHQPNLAQVSAILSPFFFKHTTTLTTTLCQLSTF
jgi:hypothetical protein